MDVVGQWFFAKWLGGGCRLVQGSEGVNTDGSGKDDDVTFFEGKLKLRLVLSSTGYWEGPTDSGLRLFRRGPHLVVQRHRGTKGRIRQTFAATSAWAAACMCYKSTLCSLLVISSKDGLLVPTAPPLKAVPQATALPETPPLVEEESEVWPEPEADGLPEQPSTAPGSTMSQLMHPPEPVCEETPETISDEKLLQSPQVSSYCLGVTSLSHQRSASGASGPHIVPLGVNLAESLRPVEDPKLQMPREDSLREASSAAEPEPRLNDASDAAGVRLDIMEDGRVVQEVSDLRTTIHGLLTVPENAELPDVPNPVAPSKSDSSLLHGTVAFDGDLNQYLQENYAIPEEFTVLHRDDPLPNEPGNPRSTEASESLYRKGEIEDEDEDDDPRKRPNPLVRSHKVSGNLSLSETKQVI